MKPKLKIFTLSLFTILFLTFFISFYNDNYTTCDNQIMYINAYSDCPLLVNSFVKTNDVFPEGAVEISDANDLKNFLYGDEPYGYVIADVLLDWDDVGSPINFANGRTLDGRGHVLTLTDKQACADIYDDEFEALNINGEGETSEHNYGLFVSINDGLIRNFKFEYADEICVVNNGFDEINGAGIVCGENNGVIANCELSASGKFSYFYINIEADDTVEYQTSFGSFAGINNGSIDKVSASYDDFTLRVRTSAQSLDYFSDGVTAKTFAGGLVGNISDSGECVNSTISGSNVIFNVTADKIGNKESYVYSGATAAYSQGKIDNIIVDFSPEYVQSSSNASVVSKNSVVHCGLATNVTALNTYGGGINLRSNTCSCAEHISYCNSVKTDGYTKAVVYIDEYDNQVIDLTPIKGLIESVSFTKLTVDGSGKIIDDNALYENSPDNFRSQNFASDWIHGKTFHVAPYQNSCKCFWEIEAQSWQKVEIEFSQEVYFNHTGKDMLKEIVKLKPSDGESYLKCDFTKMNLVNEDENIREAIRVGKYSLSIRPIEIGDRKYLYYDKENHIIAIAPEDYEAVTHEYYVVKNLVVTADWFEIEDNSKEYDGTDEFDASKIKWNSRNENVIENISFLQNVEFNAYYSQSDAGEDVEIILELSSQAEEIIIDNQVSGVQGIIQRRKVNLTLYYAETTYGDALIEYHYNLDNVIDSIDIEFNNNILMPDAKEFRFWIEESEFGNYSIDNFDEWRGYENGASLILHKAVISQLANGEEAFANLDTQSVKDLQIKFKDVIHDDIFHILDILYYNSIEDTYLPIDGISVAGTYKIKLSMPKNLQLRYELDDSLLEKEIVVAQADDTPADNDDGGNDSSPSELPEEQGKEGIDFGDNIGNDDSQNNNTDYYSSDRKTKTYGGIAIAVGVTSATLATVAILKKVLSKRKIKTNKKI